MRFLVFYNATQTYTNTVFEHVNSFQRYSAHDYLFCHTDEYSYVDADLDRFDAVAIHYSVRLPYDQISISLAEKLEAYRGLKFLFIQDEYDHTDRAGHWIRRLGVTLVFTVVPVSNVAAVYPPDQFPGVRFVSNLTGYVPEELPEIDDIEPPSKRLCVVGYRGRPLPLRYGQLGFEKVEIGRQVKEYCVQHHINHNISWSEEDRIYGARWYEFMASCRGMLGSESGSNVFDRNGTLGAQELAYRKAHPKASDAVVYAEVIRSLELPGLMNQVSPRVFEAIALRTALVLYEGSYSGVIRADEHFIPLRKDGKNLAEVFRRLQDDRAVDLLTENAFQDVIASGKYAYATFVDMVDRELELMITSSGRSAASSIQQVGAMTVNSESENRIRRLHPPCQLTQRPIQAMPPSTRSKPIVMRVIYAAWNLLPPAAKDVIKPILKKILRRK
jgi:hypothetical protein